jgi:hypothetical protein
MQKHVMTFNTFQDKVETTGFIRDEIDPKDIDDCLTFKKIVFFTGCELTKAQRSFIEKNCAFLSFQSSEY